MRVRSKALWHYLRDAGVLESTEAEIATAKREYRQLYKKAWKQRRLKQKELKPSFTLAEFDAIQQAAKRTKLKPTTFARQAILAAATHTELIPNKPVLMKALQYVTISAIGLSKAGAEKHILEPIEAAEKLLLQYLFSHDPQDIDKAQSK